MQTYFVRKIENTDLAINEDLNSPSWEKADVLTDFKSPWDGEEICKIEFCALRNSDTFYFRFKVHDSKVHTIKTDNSNASINDSDRVELFFRSDCKMSPYYCLEIDPTPRIMDFKALPGKQFDFDWKWPVGALSVTSEISKDYFIVGGAISLASLTELGLLTNNRIETGIFRAKYKADRNGEFEPTWITWVNPKTESPNFHTATSFGLLELE
ncbi:sugar-binding protein [Flavicella sediminum]|uniref:sugar-binding protein n=1 Tax=Flavicella sediminum TaxID=2585141 RepID=UPI00111CEF50|nr:sugar-binding protein [Flavicella sediminum]